MARGHVVLLAVALAAGFVGAWFMPQSYSDPPKSPGFASSRPAISTVAFDGERAMGYLRELCKLGPRTSGTEAMKQQQSLIEKHFVKLGAIVSRQEFQARQNSRPQPVSMTNLIVSWHPNRQRRILLCTHYDTRPMADQEPDQRKWSEPFQSANDGTSGVAWLMELGHHMKDWKTEVGVDFAFFDGEEFVFDPRPRADRYFFGSEHFASEYKRQPPKHKYVAGVLLDLFAGKNARFPYEQNSLLRAGAVVEQIWRTAKELNEPAFVAAYGPAVDDDHLALNAVGLPTVDIIDFDYPHWHRLSDTPDKCSPETMKAVARVLTTWIQRAK